MHTPGLNTWFCGPSGFFSGFHLGGLMPLLFWGVLLYLAYRLLTQGARAARSNAGHATAPEETPLAILKKRYAAGEIDREDYQRRKQDLEG